VASAAYLRLKILLLDDVFSALDRLLRRHLRIVHLRRIHHFFLIIYPFDANFRAVRTASTKWIVSEHGFTVMIVTHSSELLLASTHSIVMATNANSSQLNTFPMLTI